MITESISPRFHRAIRRGLGVLTVSALVVALVGVSPGCGRKTSLTEKGGETTDREKQTTAEDYLAAASTSLRQGSTSSFLEQMQLVHASEAVNNLNNYLKTIKSEKVRSLSEKDRSHLKDLFHFDAGEMAELDSAVFTKLDTYYLELCLHLADVVRSLDVQEMPALDRARLAFEWVVREVTLKERARWKPTGGSELVLGEDNLMPPEMVLPIGHGTAKERAFIFLDLLQQLGLDGCMIAYPGDAKGAVQYWIPGVLISTPEKDLAGRAVPQGIYLFDTRLGIPLPAAGGPGIARLDQVMKEPDKFRAFFAGAGARVIPKGIEQAQVRLGCPLSALSGRMQFLQDKLIVDSKMYLWVDIEGQQKRFRKAAGVIARIWNDPGDQNTPVRVRRGFWPDKKGEIDRENRLLTARRQLLPLLTVQHRYPSALHAKLREVLNRQFAIPQFAAHCLMPRSLMLRGRFGEATKPLQQGQEYIQKMRRLDLNETRTEEHRKQLGKKISEFCDQLNEAQDKLALAEEAYKEDPKGGQGGFARAKKQLDELLKEQALVANLIVYRAIGEPLSKQSSYLYCLCKQETAERFQTGLDRVAAPMAETEKKTIERAQNASIDAWRTAQQMWEENYTRDHMVTVGAFKRRFRKIVSTTVQAQREEAKVMLAAALYEELALDLSQSIAASILQSRAQEKMGQGDAVQILQTQVRLLDELGKSKVLKQFADFPEALFVFKRGALGYASADTFTWLRAALDFHIQRLKKKPQ
jgi:hypothetical protein